MSNPVRGLDTNRLRARLIAVLMVIVTASVTALGAAAVVAFDRAVAPELANRTRLIGSIVRTEIQRTVELGIPLESVGGLESHLAEALESFAEVERISVTTAAGTILAEVHREDAAATFLERTGIGAVVGFRSTAFVLPVIARNEIVGEVAVETSPLFVDIRLREVFLDVLVIALVATILALELALAVTVNSVGKPLDRVLRLLNEQRAGNFTHCIRPGGLSGLGRAAMRLNDHAVDLAERFAALRQHARARVTSSGALIAAGPPQRLRRSDLNDIRLALFLFSVATEIAAAFLPLYARAATRPAWLSPELAAAAPLVLYLLALTALSPFADRLARRFGPRRLFLTTVAPTALSLAAMGLADDLLTITLLRASTGALYALATIACQQYAVRAAAERGSTRPVAAFVAVVYGGVFCGSALGGLLAGRLGFETAFFAGSAIALLSGVLAMRAMSGRAGDPVAPPVRAAAREDPGESGFRLAGLLLGIAVPMHAGVAVFIWYLSPLMLAALGHGPAEIARVVILYYLAQVLIGPAVAQLGETRAGQVSLILAGAAISGLAVLSLLRWEGFWAITASVAGLGFGHALIRAPQTALAIAIAGTPARLGAVRLLERLGALAGLAASAFWLRDFGVEISVQIMAVAVLAGAALFMITRRLR